MLFWGAARLGALLLSAAIPEDTHTSSSIHHRRHPCEPHTRTPDYKRTASAAAADLDASESLTADAHDRGAARLRDLCHGDLFFFVFFYCVTLVPSIALSPAPTPTPPTPPHLNPLLSANGGVYVKLGQHVATLDHLLPSQYVATMRASMLDACPPSPPADVEAVIVAELGAPPGELWASFDPAPVAVASLAQVHRAVDRDGRALAIKVQHRGLREACAADIGTVAALVDIAHWVFPSFDLSWLVREVKENLPKVRLCCVWRWQLSEGGEPSLREGAVSLTLAS